MSFEINRLKTKYCLITYYKTYMTAVTISSCKIFQRIYFFIKESSFQHSFLSDYYIIVVPSFKKVPPKNIIEEYLMRAMKIPDDIAKRYRYNSWVLKDKDGYPLLTIGQYFICYKLSLCIPYGIKGLASDFTNKLLCDHQYESIINSEHKIRKIQEVVLEYFLDISGPAAKILNTLFFDKYFGGENDESI